MKRIFQMVCILAALVISVSFVSTAGAALTNLVTNGSFQDVGTDKKPVGWTLNGGVTFEKGTDFGSFTTKSNGMGNEGIFQQTLGTTSGQQYLLSFQECGTVGSLFSVLFGGTTHNYTSSADWKTYSFILTGGVDNRLQFLFKSANSTYNLKDISVTATPIPSSLLLFIPGLVGIGILRKRLGWRHSA